MFNYLHNAHVHWNVPDKLFVDNKQNSQTNILVWYSVVQAQTQQNANEGMCFGIF